MRLIHYSDAPLVRVMDRAQDPNDHKPVGLWLSVEGPDDWPNWCKGERFGLDRFQHQTVVRLTPGANVLHIKSPAGLDTFNDRYRAPRGINWPRVAKDYDGIIIAPYQWERRLQYSWYYGWDCASGCVWNSKAVEIKQQG